MLFQFQFAFVLLCHAHALGQLAFALHSLHLYPLPLFFSLQPQHLLLLQALLPRFEIFSRQGLQHRSREDSLEDTCTLRPQFQIYFHFVAFVSALDLHRLFVLHFEEVIQFLVQLVLQLFVEVYSLRPQQIVSLPGLHLSQNTCGCLFLATGINSENWL